MKYLVVNADDFGYSPSVNKGIVEAHKKGIVTSTSVMVDAIASEEAKALTQFNDLSIGLHFAVKDFNHVQNEFKRQLEKFISIVGTNPDHIDTHKLAATDKGFKDLLSEYSRQNNIPIRQFGFAKFIDSFFGMHSHDDVSVGRLKSAIDQATDDYNEIMCHVGYSDDYLRQHSSYNDMREQELRVICDPEIKQYITEKGLKLCNWKQVKLT